MVLPIDLPEEWPGRKRMRHALTLLRVSGHWSPFLDNYASMGRWGQKHLYPAMRAEFYERFTGALPDGGTRLGK